MIAVVRYVDLQHLNKVLCHKRSRGWSYTDNANPSNRNGTGKEQAEGATEPIEDANVVHSRGPRRLHWLAH